MNNQQRIETIKQRLHVLQPKTLEVIDESHLHAGHPGAQSGKGHFYLGITSPLFSQKTKIEQHRMIYQALGDFLQSDIHALRIDSND